MASKCLKVKVVKISGDKSVSCAYTSLKKHPKYEKYVKVNKKIMAHDEKNAYKVGDEIVICETVPISHKKRWKVVYADDKNENQ